MLLLLDHYLLSRSAPDADHDVSFRRIDGHPTGRVICFLPWRTPFVQARALGLCPRPFAACYEMPPAIVSSVPRQSVVALEGLVSDALGFVAERSRTVQGPWIVVGHSVGVFPAAVVAAKLGARLFAFAGADRGDLMMWQSPAAALVKRRAQQRGYGLSDFSHAMDGLNPIDQVDHVAAPSVFAFGERDPFVPIDRSRSLAERLIRSDRGHVVHRWRTGHIGTLLRSRAVIEAAHAAAA